MVRLVDREQSSSSRGPLIGMPIFGPNGGEIMDAKVDHKKKVVHILEEDSEEPGTLNPDIIPIKDFEELKLANKQLKPKEK